MDSLPVSNEQQLLLQRFQQPYHQVERDNEPVIKSGQQNKLPPLGRVLSVLLSTKLQDLQAVHLSHSKGSINQAVAALRQHARIELEEMFCLQKTLEPLLEHVTKARDRQNRKQVMAIIFLLSQDEVVGHAIIKGFVGILESRAVNARIQLGCCIIIRELLQPKVLASESSNITVPENSHFIGNKAGICNLTLLDLFRCIPSLFVIMSSSSQETPSRLSVMAADCIILISKYAGDDDATMASETELMNHVQNNQIRILSSSSSGLIQGGELSQETSEQATTSGRMEVLTKEERLWEHLDLLVKFVLLLREWNKDGRPLFAKGLQQIAKSLDNLSKFRDTLAVDNFSKFRDTLAVERDKMDLSMLIAVLSSCWNRYGLLLLMDASIVRVDHKKEILSWIEGLQHSLQAEDVDMDDAMPTGRVEEICIFFLTCLCLFIGRLSTQDRDMVLHEYGMTLLQTLFQQLRVKHEDVLGLAIAILRVLLFQSDSLNASVLKMDTVAPLLMDLLDERDSSSKAVVALIADYFSINPCAPEMGRLFGLLGSENLAQRQNALSVISELLTILLKSDNDMANTIRQTVAVHLLKRLGDTELANRTEVSQLFSKLDPEFVLPALVQNVYSRNDKVRSAASASISSLLKEQRNSSTVLCVLLDSTRNILHNQPLPIHPGEIGVSIKGRSSPDVDRIMRLVGSWAPEVQEWEEIIDVILRKMFSEPSNPVMPRFLSEISSHLLSNLDAVLKRTFHFMVQQTKSTEVNVAGIKKDDGELQEKLNALVFERLSPLLVLRTLQLAAFDGNHKELYGSSWEMGKGFVAEEQSIASILLDRTCGEYETQEVRKLSAELLGRCNPNIMLPLLYKRMDEAASNGSLPVIKSYLFAICNLVLIRGETALYNPHMPFIQQLLSQMLMWPCLSADEDTYNIQHGCIDCLALMIVAESSSSSVRNEPFEEKYTSMRPASKYIEEIETHKNKIEPEEQRKPVESVLFRVLWSMDGRHLDNLFLLKHSSEQGSFETETNLSIGTSLQTSTSFRVCMANVLIRATQQVAFKNRPQFLSRVMPFILDFIVVSRETHLKSACLQVVFSVVHNFKEQVQSYAVDLFNLSLDIMKSKASPQERLAAARVLASLLSSADSVVNELAPYLPEAMQILDTISRIDESSDLRALCEKLLQCMTGPS